MSYLIILILADELNEVAVDFVWMREAQEVLTVLHSDQPGIRRVHEHFDLLLSVRDRVYRVCSAL